MAVLFFREARVTIINPHMGLDYNFFAGFGEEDYLRIKPRVVMTVYFTTIFEGYHLKIKLLKKSHNFQVGLLKFVIEW